MSPLKTRNADLVARAEEARLGLEPGSVEYAEHSYQELALSTGEILDWKQGNGWTRPDGSRADGRTPPQ